MNTDKHIADLVHQISSFNHSWKRAKKNWGDDSPLALMLRERKSSLQARLIRDFRAYVYLAHDTENTDGEMLISLRLKSPTRLPNNVTRSDADHMPLRLVEELFTFAEISELLIN